jgi:hypothetical protein
MSKPETSSALGISASGYNGAERFERVCSRAMAPLAPMGKKRLLALLAEHGPPVDFGSPHPHVAVVAQDGVFRVRALVVDPADVEKARAAGGSFMPEHYYALGKPTGTIHLEAPTLEELKTKIEVFAWPNDW